MEKNTTENYRKPNKIEESVLKRCVRLMYLGYLEIFILFLVLDLAIWFMVINFIGDHRWFGWLITLFFALLIGLIPLSLWFTLKDIKKKNKFEIKSDEGDWEIKIEGETAKTQNIVSRINGRKIKMIIPDKKLVPKLGEVRRVSYEYVKLFDDPPAFSHNYLFISMDGKKLIEKDEIYMSKFKHMGILSFIVIPAFLVLAFINFMIGFKDEWLFYISLILLFFVLRTSYIWISNKNLFRKIYASD